MATSTEKVQELESREVKQEASVRTVVPAADIYETEQGFVVVLDVPGVRKQDLEVRIQNDTLHVEGSALKDGPAIARPYSALKFARDFRLGRNLSREDIKADLKQGVLHITLGKKPEAQARQIEVTADS